MQKNSYSGFEIVEIAVQIEVNGRDFYNRVASNTDSEKVKEVFGYLAGEEEKHKETFEDILAGIHKFEPREAYPSEYFSYMNSLASQFIFNEENTGLQQADKVQSYVEGINIGIGVEKDSILFYQEMKRNVPEEEHSQLEKIIEQERGHFRKLMQLKGKVSDEKS